MPPGDYNATLRFSSFLFPANNKATEITLHVSTGPIAAPQAGPIIVTIARDVPAVERKLYFVNQGQGTLTLTALHATTESGGEWLAVQQFEGVNGGTVTLNTTGLEPGSYTGAITAEGNRANPVSVPVLLTVVDQSAPQLEFQGVRNIATFDGAEPIALGGIVVLKGRQLSFDAPHKPEAGQPLPTGFGDTRVLLNGNPVPLFQTSYDEVTFQVPYDAATGAATVQVTRGDQSSNLVSTTVAGRAPRLLTLGDLRYQGLQQPDCGFIRNHSQDDSYPIPGRPAHPGDQLEFYAIGLGQTDPPAIAGELPTDAQNAPPPRVVFGNSLFSQITATPSSTTLVPGSPGLYRFVIEVPGNTPTGDGVYLYIDGDNYVSNSVRVAIQ
ncbi:MAG: hypothetical protein NTY38_07650, partial [Acidobacteria bacterium]|nr:hypothetical protein [Acidobacteriota bacterium]